LLSLPQIPNIRTVRRRHTEPDQVLTTISLKCTVVVIALGIWPRGRMSITTTACRVQGMNIPRTDMATVPIDRTTLGRLARRHSRDQTSGSAVADLQNPTARSYRVILVTSFAEPDNRADDDKPSIWTWSAQDDSRPLFFSPVSGANMKATGGTRILPNFAKHLVFSFLTTGASHHVSPVHSEATPVCLFDEAARDDWMTAPWELARELQRPPPSGSLRVVATGDKSDD
jgi:hypothetical protein